ncbi:MAG: hypothetical protein ACYS74_07475, partial [Planctomycetota bacterium]
GNVPSPMFNPEFFRMFAIVVFYACKGVVFVTVECYNAHYVALVVMLDCPLETSLVVLFRSYSTT